MPVAYSIMGEKLLHSLRRAFEHFLPSSMPSIRGNLFAREVAVILAKCSSRRRRRSRRR